MRTPQRWAVAVRRPDGAIHSEAHDVRTLGSRGVLARALVRGPVALVDAIRIALEAISVAVRVATGVQTQRREALTPLVAVGLSILALFVAGPGFAIGAAGLHGAGGAAAEAVLRAAMLVVYLAVVSRSRTAAELFAYHGAEHKVIAAYEKLQRLPSIDDARPFSPVHDRCGTNFVTLFVIVAGFLYTPLTRAPIGALWRVLLVPVVASLAFELMRLAAREHGEVWSRAVTWPGRAAQRLTTREPDDAELEVARAALALALG